MRIVMILEYKCIGDCRQMTRKTEHLFCPSPFFPLSIKWNQSDHLVDISSYLPNKGRIIRIYKGKENKIFSYWIPWDAKIMNLIKAVRH